MFVLDIDIEATDLLYITDSLDPEKKLTLFFSLLIFCHELRLISHLFVDICEAVLLTYFVIVNVHCVACRSGLSPISLRDAVVGVEGRGVCELSLGLLRVVALFSI